MKVLLISDAADCDEGIHVCVCDILYDKYYVVLGTHHCIMSGDHGNNIQTSQFSTHQLCY
jgi:hypothetical protein